MEERLITEVLEKYGAAGLICAAAIGVVIVLWRQLLKKDKIIIDLVGDFHKVATKSADSIDESAKALKEINNLLHTVNTDVQVLKHNGK